MYWRYCRRAARLSNIPDLPNVTALAVCQRTWNRARMETTPTPASDHETRAEQFSETLRTQRQRLTEFLAAQQARLDRAESLVRSQLEQVRDNRGDTDEDLQRRYDQVLEELHRSEAANTDLQQQLTRSRSTATKLAQQARQPGAMDWESEKQRILTALETVVQNDDETRQPDRLKVLEVIRTTDENLAAKDREIQELKIRLEEQGRLDAGKSPEEIAIEHALTADRYVQEERDRLKRLQEEWQDKLRSAEVEISLERANIARQRAELDELRKTVNLTSNSTPATGSPGKAPVQGRWLAQFGLTPADREPRRQR
jgi:hypothetical protein